MPNAWLVPRLLWILALAPLVFACSDKGSENAGGGGGAAREGDVFLATSEYSKMLPAAGVEIVGGLSTQPLRIWLNFDGGTLSQGASGLSRSPALCDPSLQISVPSSDIPASRQQKILREFRRIFERSGILVSVMTTAPASATDGLQVIWFSKLDAAATLGCPRTDSPATLSPTYLGNDVRKWPLVSFVFETGKHSDEALASLAAHALGHVLGLLHVSESKAVMNATPSDSQRDFLPEATSAEGGLRVNETETLNRLLNRLPSGFVPESDYFTFLGEDRTTQGDWTTYGKDGYYMPQGLSSLPPGVRVVKSPEALEYNWNDNNSDVRATLFPPSGPQRTARTFYTSDTYSIDVQLPAGKTYQLSLYALDWDRLGRTQSVRIVDTAGRLLYRGNMTNLEDGLWIKMEISASVTIYVTRTGTTNAVVSGLFFIDKNPEVPAYSGPLATFLAKDTMTKGNWASYGTTAYFYAGGPDKLPDGYSATLGPNTPLYSWTENTADVRALQRPDDLSKRAARTIYNGDSFYLDLEIPRGTSHRAALYFHDWDNQGRTMRVEALDSRGTVVASQTVADYSGGVWLVFKIIDSVRFRFVNTGPSNALLSGVFLSPVP